MTKKTDFIQGEEIAAPETDRLMTIFSKSGNVQIVGPLKELRALKQRIESKDNRHTFIEMPARLITFNLALEEVTVLPAEVGIIIIADPAKAAMGGKILQPVSVIPKKLN